MESVSNATAARAGDKPGGGQSNCRRLAKWMDFAIAAAFWAAVEFVLLKVVPVFADIFRQFGGKLPAPTRWTVFLSGFPGVLLVPLLLAFLAVFQFWRTVCMPPPLPGDTRLPWDRKVVLALIVLGAFTFLFAVVSLYMPITTLGDQMAN